MASKPVILVKPYSTYLPNLIDALDLPTLVSWFTYSHKWIYLAAMYGIYACDLSKTLLDLAT